MIAFRVFVLGCLAAGLLAADSLATVPPDVATLVEATRGRPPVEVLARVAAYGGPEHALIHLVRGQALLQANRRDEAATAFRTALGRAPDLKAAHLGLARIAAEAEDWTTAAREGAAGLDLATADAVGFAFLAQVGLRSGDLRLASHAIQQGILRFPTDESLRDLDIALLASLDQPEELRAALRGRLSAKPANPDLWSHLAQAADGTHRSEEALAARELAWLADPANRERRRHLAEAQAAAGQVRPALVHWRALVATGATAEEWERAAHTAEQAGEVAQARAWLANIPAPRPRRVDLLAARLALAAQDPAEARAAFDRLLAAGDADPAVHLWAGHLAEQVGDTARAEACYRAAGDGPATIRLVGLLLRADRRDEARSLVAIYRAQHPQDATVPLLERLVPATP